MISTSRQFLSEMGRVSIISTLSPTLHSFFSSCALNLTVCLMIFLYRGCFLLPSIATTIVSVHLIGDDLADSGFSERSIRIHLNLLLSLTPCR